MGKLTARQERFVEAYLIDPNASAAARAAGSTAKRAEQAGYEFMINPDVKAEIERRRTERAQKAAIDAEYVLQQAVKLHERCMQEVEPFTDRKGNHIHDEEGRPLYVFNANGAARALELVGKHIGVQAFKEQVAHDVTDALADRLVRAAERLKSDG